MTQSIRHKLFFEHPAAVVWDYLTKADLIEQWLMKNDFLPVVGHDFTFHTRPIPHMDFDGIVHCKVLEVIPHQKLSYSWKGGPGNGKVSLDSTVVWTLIEKDNGTELSLEHSGFMENFSMYSAMNEGWLKNMNKITELIKTSIHGSTKA